MAIFIVLWPCLFTTKLSCLQKNKWGHANQEQRTNISRRQELLYKCITYLLMFRQTLRILLILGFELSIVQWIFFGGWKDLCSKGFILLSLETSSLRTIILSYTQHTPVFSKASSIKILSSPYSCNKNLNFPPKLKWLLLKC